MADANLTALDATHLHAFIAGPLLDFKNAVAAMRSIAPAGDPAGFAGVPGMFDLGSSATGGLAIGGLAALAELHGDVFAGGTKAAETQVDATFQANLKTFTAIHTDMQKVVTTLLNAEADNLAAVDGQKFIDAFQDVNASLGATG